MHTNTAFKHYQNGLLAAGRSPRTIQSYGERLGGFLALFGSRELGEISPEDVDGWLIRLREQSERWGNHPCTPPQRGKLSPATVYARGRAAQMFLGFCQRRGYVALSPAAHLRLTKPKQKGVKAMGEATAVALERATKMRAAAGQNRDLALFHFMLDSGCRSGEVASIQLADVDWGGRSVWVSGKTGPRRAFFTEATAVLLRAWLVNHPGGEWLFCGLHLSKGKQMNPNSIYQMFKRRAADMDISERHNPHAVRHLVGVSAVAQLGIREAQLLLGHEDINSTLVYAGVDDERIKEVTDKLRILP